MPSQMLPPDTWLARCSVLCEATQHLLVAAVSVATDGEKAAPALSASAARFDSVAVALEEDLLALAAAAAPPPDSRAAPRLSALRQFAIDLVESDAVPAKRPRRS